MTDATKLEKFNIYDPRGLARLATRLKEWSYPFCVAIKPKEDRTLAQNNTVHGWYGEIAKHFGDRTSDDVRSECKLTFGVRMLVAEDDAFREQWMRLFGQRFSYEEKLELMSEPHNYPVTSIMTAKQMARYMDQVFQHYGAQGVRLTDPEMMKYGVK